MALFRSLTHDIDAKRIKNDAHGCNEFIMSPDTISFECVYTAGSGKVGKGFLLYLLVRDRFFFFPLRHSSWKLRQRDC